MNKAISFLVAIFILACLAVSSQKITLDNVPDAVIQSLDYEYPGIKINTWLLENSKYVAVFKDEGHTGRAYFDAEGTWIETAYSIPKKELPSALTEFIAANYPFFTYAVIQLKSNPQEKLHYYIEVKPEDVIEKNSCLYFDENGKLLKRKDPPSYKDPNKNKKEEQEIVYEEETTGRANKPVVDDKGNVAITKNSIPEIVVNAFNKKIKQSENIHWFKIDSFFVAKSVYREQQQDNFFTPQGVWVKTVTKLPETAITGNLRTHLDKYYKGWLFENAVKETRADKNDITLVEIVERKNVNTKANSSFKKSYTKLTTTFLFDKSGKLIRSYDPEYIIVSEDDDKQTSDDLRMENYYKKMNMEKANEEESKSIPQKILNAFQAKYPRITAPQWEQDEDGDYLASYMGARGKEYVKIGQSGTILQTLTTGNMDIVPETISKYIKSNYKGDKITEYFTVKDLQSRQNVYKVILFNKKTGENTTLWFSIAGKLLER